MAQVANSTTVQYAAGADNAGLWMALLIGALILVVLLFVLSSKKKKKEDYEPKSAEWTTSSTPTSHETKTDTATTGSSVKYGKGFGRESVKESVREKEKPAKETEEFYRYYKEDGKKVTCLCCGIENEQGSRQCTLCGQKLYG